MVRNRVIYTLTTILCLILAINVVRSYVNLSERGSILHEAEQNVQKAQTRNEALKRELARVGSFQYMEQEARNKLSLSKDGEIVVLLPSIPPPSEPTPTIIENIPNWERWRRVFF